MIWEAFAAEGKKSIMLNYCEAWPPRTEDENSIFIDGTGVVPFLRCQNESRLSDDERHPARR